jgi:PAS domain S-box-containing protein
LTHLRGSEMRELRKNCEALGLPYDQLFDEAPCWISVQDRQFHILGANRKLVEDFGNHQGERCYTVYKGRSEPCAECPVKRSFEDGGEHTTQEMIFDRRGLPHEVLVKTRPLCNGSGETVAVMKLFADISAEKELEARLHDSLVRFQNLFDNTPCFVTVQDREFRVLESNRSFNESFGEGRGRHCYEVYKKRSERCPHCPVAETFSDGAIHTSEEMVVDQRGREVHVLVYTAPIRDREGAITSVMEMSTDITEIRSLQNRLATLGELVGGIAHSIKNILDGLRGGVYIVNLGFHKRNDADVHTGWEMVERNVARLSSLILDMLCCARDRSPRRLPVSLDAVIRDVVALLAPRATQHGIQLHALLGEAVSISGEPKDIHALVSNLIANAIDACNADPEERQHRVAVRLVRDEREAVIEVEDDGPGVPQEIRETLFHRLVSTKGSSGTGLGLMVAHKVATEHGGRVSLRSEPGKGSTFAVRLPAHQTRFGPLEEVQGHETTT